MIRKFYDIELTGSKGGVVFGEWQLCPKCLGQGTVSRPPGLPADIQEFSSTQINYTCDICTGSKIIQRPLIPTT